MVPNGAAYNNFPPFATNGTKTPPGGSPESAKYALGMVPADTFPAEWANYLFYGATQGITRLNQDTGSIKKEINTVLSNFNITPDATEYDQLLEALNKLKAEAALAAHPVGSLYWTSSTENPATTFGGGTWVQIKDKFILSAGDTYSNGGTGGSATVTLTSDQIPSHKHSFTPAGTISVTTNPIFSGSEHSHSYTPQGTVSKHKHTVGAHAHGLNSHTHTLSGTLTTKNTIETGSTTAKTLSGKLDYLLSKTNMQPTTNGIVSITSDDALASDGTNWGIRKMGITLDATHRHQVDLSGNTGAASGSTANSTAFDSGETQPTFTGTAATIKGTAGGTISGGAYSFSGTAGNTGNTGGGGSHDNMPPYVVKYCWERTA